MNVVPSIIPSVSSAPAAPASFLDAALMDTQGMPVRLGSLIERSPVLFVFVRHFGCVFCKEQVADVIARRTDFAARGVEPVVVGHGTVEEAQAFAAAHAAGLRVFTDPTREAYCAVGMKRGLGTSMSVGVVKRAARAYARGFRQTRTQGDALQQGGVILLAPDGRMLFEFISDEAGEHPSLDDVLAAVR